MASGRGPPTVSSASRRGQYAGMYADQERQYDVLESVYNSIIYVGVPMIILSMLFLSMYLAVKTPRESRLSATAGLFAGLVAFTIYLVGSFSGANPPRAGLEHTPSFKWLPLVAGVVAGFMIPFLAQKFQRIHAGLTGIFVLFLSATSSTATFSYFFASSLRDVTIFLALGSLFGILIYAVFYHPLIRDAFPGRGRF